MNRKTDSLTKGITKAAQRHHDPRPKPALSRPNALVLKFPAIQIPAILQTPPPRGLPTKRPQSGVLLADRFAAYR
jgi:hypothetical protein